MRIYFHPTNSFAAILKLRRENVFWCKSIVDRDAHISRGGNPMVKVVRNPVISYLDVALQEIAEGKLTYVPTEDD